MAFTALLFGCLVALSGGEALAQAQGGFPDKRMEDFQKRRACEQNLPTCLPQVRRQIEQERSSRIWMGSMVGGVLLLLALMVVRANRQRQIESQQLVAKSRQAARRRKEQQRSGNQDVFEEDEDDDDGLPSRSTIERPPGFGRR